MKYLLKVFRLNKLWQTNFLPHIQILTCVYKMSYHISSSMRDLHLFSKLRERTVAFNICYFE